MFGRSKCAAKMADFSFALYDQNGNATKLLTTPMSDIAVAEMQVFLDQHNIRDYHIYVDYHPSSALHTAYLKPGDNSTFEHFIHALEYLHNLVQSSCLTSSSLEDATQVHTCSVQNIEQVIKRVLCRKNSDTTGLENTCCRESAHV